MRSTFIISWVDGSRLGAEQFDSLHDVKTRVFQRYPDAVFAPASPGSDAQRLWLVYISCEWLQSPAVNEAMPGYVAVVTNLPEQMADATAEIINDGPIE